MYKYTLLVLITLGFIACDDVEDKQKLPVLGNPTLKERMVAEETIYDTIPHTIGYFRFFNQDSTVITPESLEGKIYVADFFFTSCISICPVMKNQMKRVYDKYQDQDSLAIVSFSIDPEYDTVNLLKNFAQKMEVSSKTWHFLTGDKEEIYNLAFNSFMTEKPAEDPTDRNNILHSGAFILVDTQKRIRGVYDGTVPDQVDLLIKDISKLLKEDE